MDIKTIKLVRGKGLCEQITSKEVLELEGQTNTVLLIGVAGDDGRTTSWLQGMVHFLRTGECPATLDKEKWRYYHLQYIPFVLINDVLYQKDYNGVLLRCVETDQAENILHEFHDGHLGGHCSPRTIAYKIL